MAGVRLVRLKVVRLPGIGREFTLESLDPQVNILTGPNASGKSSVVRAVRALLYADEAKGQGVLVEGEFEAEGQRLTVQRLGDIINWRSDGTPIEPPELPDHRFLSCYAISIEELSATVAGDGEISRRVARELSGGYDLSAVRANPAFNPPRAGRSEKSALDQATKSVEKLRRQRADLARQERELDELEEQRHEARSARDEVEQLESALQLLAQRELLERVQSRLAREFPEGMEQLVGNELEQLDRLLEAQEALREQWEDARGELDAAERTLRESGLAGSDISRETLAEARSLLGELQKLEPRIETIREAEIAARQAAGELGERLGISGNGAALAPGLVPSDVSAAEGALEEKRKLEAAMLAIEEGPIELTDGELDDRGPSLERLREARRALLGWLAATHGSPTGALFASLLLLLGTAGFALPWLTAGAPLAQLMPAAGELRLPWAVTAALLFTGGLLLAVRGSGKRRAERLRFARTGIGAPEGWRHEAVSERLDSLGEEIAAAEERLRLDAERQRLGRSLRSLRERRASEVERLTSLAERFGFDPLTLDASFALWLGLAREYEKARRETGEASIGRESLERQWKEHLYRLVDLLGRYDGAGSLSELHSQPWDDDRPPFTSLAAQLEVLVSALERRLEQRDSARSAAAGADREGQRLERESGRKAEEIAGLLSRAGLGDLEVAVARRELETRLGYLDGWKALDGERRDHERRAIDLATGLAARPELLELAEEGSEDGLQERFETKRQLADRHDELHGRISAVTERIRAAREERNLELAVAAQQSARDELTRRLEEALFAEAGRFLLDQVQVEHGQTKRPEGLELASDYFGRFTHNRYGLQFDGTDERFAAVENDTGSTRPLGELSTGTRAQLLLAIRVAFAQQLERGRLSLPLFLDEALTTADHERFAAVTQSLRLLAAEGRQIFYLSARDEDGAYWRSEGADPPKVIDMAQLRRLAAAAPKGAFELPARKRVPLVAGLSPDEYAAELAVPPVDPWANPEAVHLFHLLRDDLTLLRELLEAGVERLGSLEAYLSSPELTLMPTVEEERRLILRCRAARAWLEAWRVGRGRPLERQALVESGAVSESFIARVDELRESVGGDARALIQGLRDRRVRGFQRAKIAELEEWLSENDYLDERSRMSQAELARHVAEAVTRHAHRPEGRDAGGTRQEERREAVVEPGQAGALPATPSGSVERLRNSLALKQATSICDFLSAAVAAWAVTV